MSLKDFKPSYYTISYIKEEALLFNRMASNNQEKSDEYYINSFKLRHNRPPKNMEELAVYKKLIVRNVDEKGKKEEEEATKKVKEKTPPSTPYSQLPPKPPNTRDQHSYPEPEPNKKSSLIFSKSEEQKNDTLTGSVARPNDGQVFDTNNFTFEDNVKVKIEEKDSDKTKVEVEKTESRIEPIKSLNDSMETCWDSPKRQTGTRPKELGINTPEALGVFSQLGKKSDRPEQNKEVKMGDWKGFEETLKLAEENLKAEKSIQNTVDSIEKQYRQEQAWNQLEYLEEEKEAQGKICIELYFELQKIVKTPLDKMRLKPIELKTKMRVYEEECKSFYEKSSALESQYEFLKCELEAEECQEQRLKVERGAKLAAKEVDKKILEMVDIASKIESLNEVSAQFSDISGENFETFYAGKNDRKNEVVFERREAGARGRREGMLPADRQVKLANRESLGQPSTYALEQERPGFHAARNIESPHTNILGQGLRQHGGGIRQIDRGLDYFPEERRPYQPDNNDFHFRPQLNREIDQSRARLYDQGFRRGTLKHELPTLDYKAKKVKEFYLFKNSFEAIMDHQHVPEDERLYFLQKAVENRDLKEDLLSFPHTKLGYTKAMDTLVSRFGGEQCLKIERLNEIDRFSYDTSTSKGLFKLLTLVNSITSDKSFDGEKSKTSLLFNKIFSKLNERSRENFNFRYPKRFQDLDTLGEYIEYLATSKMEQEELNKLSKEAPRSGYKIRNYSTKVEEEKPAEDNSKVNKRVQYCNVCKGNHATYFCLKNKPQNEVERILREKYLCFLCFSSFHGARECPSKQRCRQCGEKHNSIMHKHRDRVEKTKTEHNTIEIEVHKITPVDSRDNIRDMLPVKFSPFIIPVYIRNKETDEVEETLVFLDQGSDETWISSDLAEKLNLKTLMTTNCTISTVNGSRSYDDTAIVGCQVLSLDKSVCIDLICRAMQKIPQFSCTFDIDKLKRKYSYLDEVLMYPTRAKNVGLCLGRDYLSLHNQEKIIEGGRNEPKAYKLKLGWTVIVPRTQDYDEITSMNFISSNTTIEDQNKGLISLDFKKEELRSELPLDEVTNMSMRKILTEDNLFIENKPPFSKDEEIAYNLVKNSFVYEKGRPTIELPFNEKIKNLGNNLPQAMARLKGSLARLQKANIVLDFKRKIDEGVNKRYFEIVDDKKPGEGQKFYIPTAPVVKVDRSTSKLRVVYDASCRWYGLSLNDCLRPGPNLRKIWL